VKSAAGALHLGIFDQPKKNDFFNRLLIIDRTPVQVLDIPEFMRVAR